MELLIVVLIIILVSSMGINTYRNQSRQVKYNDALFKVLTLIKTARSYTMTSRSVYDTCQLPGQETYIPPDGYGVYINQGTDARQTRFVLFANTKAGTDIEKVQYDEDTGNPCNSDLIEEDYLLDGEAILSGILSSLLPSPTGTVFASKTNDPEKEVVIIFKPPLADATVVSNDHQPVEDLTSPVDLYLQFERVTSSAGTYNYIHMSRIAGFAEILNQ